MFLKRTLILAVGILLFIAAFIIYSYVSHAQMEGRFRQEREKFNVEGVVLTSSGPATPATTPDAPAAQAADTNTLTSPVPPTSATPDNTAAPTAPATPDTNAAPSPSTSPAAPDPNSAPAPTPSSTMNGPRSGGSPIFQLAAYRPAQDSAIKFVSLLSGAEDTSNAPVVAAPPTNPAPSTATAVTPVTTAPTPTTNTAPGPSSAVVHSGTRDGKVIVLLYHQFKAPGVAIPAKFQWTLNQDVFESEMKYIHDNGYHVIPMSDLLKFLHHEISVPPNSVCITIDDGYKSAIVYAAPILKKYGYPWTFFIYPDFITVGEGPGAASWNDLLELQKEGVDIESHSMTHPQLTHHKQLIKGVWHNFTPEEYDAWLTNETAGSKALLEQKMGKPITCFAYPYGDYNKQVEAKAIAAGYEAIFTVADNPVHASTNLYSVGRYTITQGVVRDFPAYLRQGALAVDTADPAPGTTTSNPRPVITATLGYAGTLDPKSIETSVRDYGVVRHDFDPQTNTLRLYLPRDLIQPVNLVNIRAEDAATKQVMVANWHFNYAPDAAASTPLHPPIVPLTKNPSSVSTAPIPPATNAPEAAEPESMEKTAAGTPLDAHRPTPPPAPPAPPPVSPTSDRD